MFLMKYGNILNKELLLMEYGHLLKKNFLFDNENNEIKDCNKLRFSSNLNLPLYTLIEFQALTLAISCVIEKDGDYYPEIYLNEGFYIQNY